ncbi:hypothetical protein DL764_007936 [Monosporascus ibericus]|uniref:Uncharacterized protein n=1 Tax=Monosporascus ibericus TaxID=155417 RepID=A0A4Q4T107_9PEZI|nr:hypothetical protein DL764_007936 [Monosporascus ibericus]
MPYTAKTSRRFSQHISGSPAPGGPSRYYTESGPRRAGPQGMSSPPPPPPPRPKKRHIYVNRDLPEGALSRNPEPARIETELGETKLRGEQEEEESQSAAQAADVQPWQGTIGRLRDYVGL